MQENSPCVCPVCNKAFIRQELMKDHLRRKHKMYRENYAHLVTKDKDSQNAADYDDMEDLDVKPEIQLEEGSSDPTDAPSAND